MVDDSENHTQPIICSIVIPMYNESAVIAQSLGKLQTWVEHAPFPVEILLADDGSTDSTIAVASKSIMGIPQARIIPFPHRGKAATVLDALKLTIGRIAGFMDADMATPIEMVVPAVETLLSADGVVIGSREGLGSSRTNEPFLRHFMGRVFNRMVRTLLLPGIHDTQCGFKFFSRSVLDLIMQSHQLYREVPISTRACVTAFDIELLYIAKTNGFPITSIPVHWTHGSKSTVSPVTDSVVNCFDLIRVRRNAWRGLYKHN